MKMWRPKCTGSCISLSTGMNLRSSCKETLMIVYGSEVFRCGSVSRFFFSLRFRAHLCIREGRANSYGTLIKNEPLFIEFTIFHVSSRRDFYPPREPVRFSKLRLTRYVERFVRISYGARWREKTLHYNYSVKKFKSLNIVRRATIQTALKVEGTRTRLCKRGGASHATTRYLMHKHATKTRHSMIFRSVLAVTGYCLLFSELFSESISWWLQTQRRNTAIVMFCYPSIVYLNW
jgi:hypothetical protein